MHEKLKNLSGLCVLANTNSVLESSLHPSSRQFCSRLANAFAKQESFKTYYLKLSSVCEAFYAIVTVTFGFRDFKRSSLEVGDLWRKVYAFPYTVAAFLLDCLDVLVGLLHPPHVRIRARSYRHHAGSRGVGFDNSPTIHGAEHFGEVEYCCLARRIETANIHRLHQRVVP